MLERLANVIFWGANVFAVLTLLFGCFLAFTFRNGGLEVLVTSIIISLLIGVIGRVVRYVLVGKSIWM